MKFCTHLSVRMRIGIGFALILLLFAAGLGVARISMKHIADMMNVSCATAQLVELSSQASEAVNTFLLHNDSASIQTVTQSLSEMQKTIPEFTHLIEDQASLADLEEVKHQLANYKQNFETIVSNTDELKKHQKVLKTASDTILSTIQDEISTPIEEEQNMALVMGEEVSPVYTEILSSMTPLIGMVKDARIYENYFYVYGGQENIDRFNESLDGWNASRDDIKFLIDTAKNDTFTDAFQKIKEGFDIYNSESFAKLVDLRRSIQETSAQMDSIGNKIKSSVATLQANAQDTVSTTIAKTVKLGNGLLIGGIAAGIFFACMIMGSIIGPIRTAMAFAERIRQGDLSQRIDSNCKDELGRLGFTLNSMADGLLEKANTMQAIAQGDLSRKIQWASDEDVVGRALSVMSNELKGIIRMLHELIEHVVKGNLSYRADPSSLHGEFKQMIEGMNDLLDAFMTPMDQAMHAIEKQAQGEFDLIETSFSGDYENLRNNVNNVSRTLRSITGQFKEMDEAAKNGDLSYRGRPDEYAGAYCEIVEVVNNTLDALTSPLNMAVEYIEQISRGIKPEYVTQEYNGDFNRIKNSINQLLKSLESMLDDSQALARAAGQGELDFQTDLSRHMGHFREIVQGINQTLHQVALPLSESNRVLQALADRDLSQLIQSEYAGELNILKSNINTSILNLSETLLDVVQAVQMFTSSSEQIKTASNTLSQGAVQQAAALQEITSSMQEIAGHSSTSAENAREANQLVQAVSDAAKTGEQRISEMMTAMQEINDSSEQIAKIIRVIDDIAFQTNLLALNAAVEAARAGRHGKGFAVVADEVRNLAGRSAKAAHETAALIEASTNRSNKGLEVAQAATTAFSNISEGVGKATTLVGEIANAANEQAQGIAQINISLGHVDSITQQNTSNAEETASAAEELSLRSNKLQALVNQFNLSEYDTHQLPAHDAES